jgi:hypothetical protein
MRPRLAPGPDPIAAATSVEARASDGRRIRAHRLVCGRVLPVNATGPGRLVLPYGLDASEADGDAEPVAARVDIEEHHDPFARPELERIERGRDFYLSDGTGHALVRILDPGDAPNSPATGRLHDDVELHLDGPFVTRELQANATRRARSAFIRTLRPGQLVYVWGPVRVEPAGLSSESGLAARAGGYRDAPAIAVFTGTDGPLHLYDEPAFKQLAAWQALPWYRKLSVIVRNR